MHIPGNVIIITPHHSSDFIKSGTGFDLLFPVSFIQLELNVTELI